jgi:hypothetical protein
VLLVGSAALQIVTLLLPWEHLDKVSDHLALDLGVSTFITAVPLNGILYASWLPHAVLAAIFWDEFWRGALLFIGLLLVLAFCSATRVALRWSFAVLYGLWLLYTTVLALSFATTAHASNTGAYALPAHPAWWEQYVRVSVTRAGAGGNLLSPAWGYWLYIAALMLCWLALGLTISLLLRSGSWSAARAENDGPKRARKLPIAAILVTIGAVVWITSVVALPLLVADCSRPLVPLRGVQAQRLCQIDAVVYPLQLSALSFFLDPLPERAYSLVTFNTPGNALLVMLDYFRNFGLLELAMLATPLALVAVWRAWATRGCAAWLSAWAALILVATGFLLHVVSELLSPHPSPVVRLAFAEGIGPAAVLMPLGVVLIVAGVALYWLQLRRDGFGAARAADVA